MKDEGVSEHAGLRRMMRTSGNDERTFTEMWDAGIPCDVKYRSYDEARYDMLEDVVVLKKDGQIITVLHAEGEEVTLHGE